MRYQGKLTQWKDDQGFGFVSPNGGGDKAFVHISAFYRQSPRPIENDLITYELSTDAQGRLRAKNVRFAHELVQPKTPYQLRVLLTIVSISILLCLLSVSQQTMLLTKVYLVLSAITFIAYAIDKRSAKSDSHRIAERTLHALATIGGWPGSLLAHQLLRHKSVKKEFRAVFWLTVAANLLALDWLITQ
jgi:uncharacterized membrane protein YsdA (DUF1294 family)/cold shock CspA family protein